MDNLPWHGACSCPRPEDHGDGDEGAQEPPSGGYESEGGGVAGRITELVSAMSWTSPGRGRDRTPTPAVGMCDGSFRTLQVDRRRSLRWSADRPWASQSPPGCSGTGCPLNSAF